jgi:hypothetical protein
VVLSAAIFTGVQFYQATACGTEIDSMEILTVLPVDSIGSIDHPKFISGEKADKQMREDEPVIGVRMAGETKAYPLYVLSAHEIVNDFIVDTPIAVTW